MNTLTYNYVNGLKPESKNYRKYDGGGLYIEVRANGSKLWRFKYVYNKKSNLLSFGKFPDVSLKEARQKRDDAKKLLVEKIDPSAERKEQVKKHEIQKLQAESTLNKIFDEWFEKKKVVWSSGHTRTVKQRFLKNAAPLLSKHIFEIEPSHIMSCLQEIEKKGHVETAHRILQILNQVFTFAIIKGICKNNPAFNLSGFLSPAQPRPMPSITKPDEIGTLLKAIETYPASPIVKNGLLLIAYTFLRPGELRTLRWEYINFEEKIIELPSEAMKNKLPHIVPLSKTALDILNDQKVLTGQNEYVFPGIRDRKRPMSNNTLNKALGIIGYERSQIVPHGFRSMASTNLYESGKFEGQVIEKQLSHVDNNKVRSAYNRYDYFKERVEMMEWYGEFLDNLRK